MYLNGMNFVKHPRSKIVNRKSVIVNRKSLRWAAVIHQHGSPGADLQAAAIGSQQMIGVHHILRRVEGDDAMIQEHDPVEMAGCLVEVMCRYHHRDILVAQRVQRFATLEDMKRQHCTIEEMEEYEPHIVSGSVVFAGVDYADILNKAESDADVILWDGGNNDLPFYKPDLSIVVADPLRAGHELTYYPGETNLRMADVVVINKIDSADLDAVNLVRPKATPALSKLVRGELAPAQTWETKLTQAGDAETTSWRRSWRWAGILAAGQKHFRRRSSGPAWWRSSTTPATACRCVRATS